MGKSPTFSDITDLFSNSDPAASWGKAVDVVTRMSPSFDFAPVHTVFNDIVRLYHGEYPGYCQIKTPYHDLSHILDVFLCAVRLMHGMQLSGAKLSDREITLIIIAALLHDVGYAQLRDGKETGTGAQYTSTHVQRGIEFIRNYIRERSLPADYADDLEPIVYCSDPRMPISHIKFPDKRIYMAGQALGTADLVGQMADRHYLEKLVALFLEFEEAQMGNYKSVHDMLRKTKNFYADIQRKLDDSFGGLYRNLTLHFKDTLGSAHNYYMESIRKNMDYLTKVTSMSESDYLSQLRRGGIVNRIKSFLRS